MFIVLTKKLILAIIAVILAIAVVITFVIFNGFDFSQAIATLKTDSKMLEVENYELDVEAAAYKKVPIYGVDRTDNSIALTIDAAWGSDKTSQILDILDQKDVKATWFLCGFWVDKYSKEVKQIAKKGHEIGNHTATHPHLSSLTADQVQKEILDVEVQIEKITGKKTNLLRAPFGEYNDAIITEAEKLGYQTIQWSASTNDWKANLTADSILNSTLKQIDSGAIILTHNNADTILDYLPKLIDSCRANGYEFVTLSELLLTGDTTVDANGIQKLTSK